MEANQKVVMLKVSNLSNHPVADQVPMLPEDHPESRALRHSIAENGIQTPLHCDASGRVSEGRHRLRTARALGIAEVPCIVESVDAAATMALQTAIARRQFNPGQKAILIASLHRTGAEERKMRRMVNLKKGSKPPEIPEAAGSGFEAEQKKSQKSLAEMVGVSVNSMQRAERLLSAVGPKAEKAVERVMSGEIELGAAVAGLSGGAATEGKKKPVTNYGRLFLNNFKSFARFARHFGKIENPRQRNEVIEAAESLPKVLPDELLKALVRGIKQARAGK